MNNNNFLILSFIFLLSFSCFSFCFECYSDCETCSQESDDYNDMKCLSCKNEEYSLLFNTSNCVLMNKYPTYFNFKNETDNVNYLYPCSFYENTNCYECNPYMLTNDRGMCYSCNPGYEFTETNECHKCTDEYIKIIINDFDECVKLNYVTDLQFCNKYITYCTNIPKSSDYDCPDDAPIFNSLDNSCTDMDCPEEGFENGTCIIKKQKYKDRKFFIYWINDNDTYLEFPSFNNDNSGNLLIEFSFLTEFIPHKLMASNIPSRKLIFLDEEGRGFFDKLNDISEKIITYDTNSYRFLSVSTAVKCQ